VVPPVGDLHWPPCLHGLFREGRQSENAQHKKKTMKTKLNSDSELKNRTAQRSEGKKTLPKIDLVKRRRNRSLPTERLLTLLQKEAPRL